MAIRDVLNWAWVVSGAFLLLQTPCAAQDAALPSLILQSGETRTLPSQRWLYQSVVIPAGARLVVEPSSGEPFQLVVRGDLELQGEIVAREWMSDESTYVISIPTGDPIEVAFQNRNRGGDGANGGDAGGRGGRGARGTFDHGGGGGGGAANATYHGGPGRVDGGDADGDRGGRAGATSCGRAGANGAQRAPYANGGVVYLEIGGALNAEGGAIDVRGEPGLPGQNGRPAGTATTACFPGAGGAGGGAPGGQGGVVIGYVRGAVSGYPRILTLGGDGGPAGSPVTGGTAAPGQRGRTGWVRWLP